MPGNVQSVSVTVRMKSGLLAEQREAMGNGCLHGRKSGTAAIKYWPKENGYEEEDHEDQSIPYGGADGNDG